MTNQLSCAAWIVILPEPQSAAFADRLKVQEEYLGGQIAPWLVGSAPAWLPACHSFHFMRYIGATHTGHGGISIELRFLGTATGLGGVTTIVQSELEKQKAEALIASVQFKGVDLWDASADYGGSGLAEPFANLLAASSRLALELLREPRRDFSSRHAVAQNWIHCVALTTLGTG